MTQPLKQQLVDAALALGFAAVRVTSPDALGPAPERLARVLQAGRHGDMDWLAAHEGRRADPKASPVGVRT